MLCIEQRGVIFEEQYPASSLKNSSRKRGHEGKMSEQEKKPEDTQAEYAFFRGGQMLGTLKLDYSEFPWHRGEFVPTPEFEEVRALFEELFHSPMNGTFDETLAKVNEPGVCLKSLFDDSTLHHFILHIRNNRFRLRLLNPI